MNLIYIRSVVNCHVGIDVQGLVYSLGSNWLPLSNAQKILWFDSG